MPLYTYSKAVQMCRNLQKVSAKNNTHLKIEQEKMQAQNDAYLAQKASEAGQRLVYTDK